MSNVINFVREGDHSPEDNLKQAVRNILAHSVSLAQNGDAFLKRLVMADKLISDGHIPPHNHLYDFVAQQDRTRICAAIVEVVLALGEYSKGLNQRIEAQRPSESAYNNCMQSPSAATVIFCCPKCGAGYQAKQQEHPSNGFQSFNCEVCRAEVFSWSGVFDYAGWKPVEVHLAKSQVPPNFH